MSSIVRVGGSNVDQSADLRGLTTDTKPTRAGGQEVPHGSIWFNMDDSTRYMYNANTDAWYRISDLQITDDTKVSKSSIAPIEDTLVATQAYAIGDEFWISDTLYMVTAPIAQGDGIVIGTNCEVAAKLVTQIKNIKDDVSDLEDTVEDISDTIAPTEATATASQAYAVNDQFFYNGNLMTATSPISQNDAIVVYPTSGYNCKLSNSVTGQIADRVTYADNGVLGAKNLLPIKLSEIKAINSVGTWSNNVYSYNGIDYTFTVENGYITKVNVNGNASDLSVLKLCNGIKSLVGGRYILSGCPSGGSISTYFLQGYRVESADGQSGSVQDAGNGVAFDYLNTVTNDNFSILVIKNTTVNVDYYPMLRLATDIDPTYQPYAQTNRKLTVNKAENSVIGTVEDGATASHAYAVDDQFFYNGNLMTATSPISQGSAIIVYPTSGYNCKLSDSITKQIGQKVSWADADGYVSRNLFDGIYPNMGNLQYKAIYVGNGTFTMSTSCPMNPSTAANLFFLAGNVQGGASTADNGVWANHPITVTAVDGYVTVGYRKDGGVDPQNYKTQIERGSVATSYMPYLIPNTDLMSYKDASDAVGWDVGNLFDYSKFVGVNIKNGTAVFENNGITITSTANDCYNWARKITNEYGTDGVIPWAVPVSEGDRIKLLWDYETGDAYGQVYIFPNGLTTGFVAKIITEKYIEYLVPSGVTFVSFRFGVQEANKTSHYKNIVLRHLTVNEQKVDNSVVAPVEDGATCANPNGYAVGEHFIRDGKFCTCTSAVTTSSDWTLNTNYVEGTIADNLVKQATFSGTTSSLSNMAIDSVYRHVVGICPDNKAIIGFPYKTTSDELGFHFVTNSMTALAEGTSINGTYYYIN